MSSTTEKRDCPGPRITSSSRSRDRYRTPAGTGSTCVRETPRDESKHERQQALSPEFPPRPCPETAPPYVRPPQWADNAGDGRCRGGRDQRRRIGLGAADRVSP